METNSFTIMYNSFFSTPMCSFHSNGIGDEGARIVATALKGNVSLTELVYESDVLIFFLSILKAPLLLVCTPTKLEMKVLEV